MIGKKLLWLIMLLSLLGSASFSEEQDRIPEEYQEDEFPALLRDLRRGEIIFLGSLPITLFFTFFTHDIYRFIAHEWNPEYAPWPFRRPGGEPYTDEEKIGVLVSALSISFLVALSDFIIGKIIERRDSNRPDQHH
ncbi:hypothetical protein ES703_15936 [subsurface metagenome]